MRVVFDTNVFISAFVIPGGRAEEAYLRAVDGDFELHTSLAILTETAGILQTKFKWSGGRIAQALANIAAVAQVRRIHPTLHVLADEPDNRVLECALSCQAEFIVTGDKALLSLRNYQNTSMVSLAAFLAAF